MHLDIHGEIEASARLQRLINVAEALSQKYDAVVTNPPYLNSSRMSNKMNNYVKKHYAHKESWTDFFSYYNLLDVHIQL